MNAKKTDAHILTSVTYASRANPDVSQGDFDKILDQARRNNSINGITGMLTFNTNYFLQTIEGPRSEINRLLYKLIDDPRHYDLQIIESKEIKMREWSEWFMNYATPTEANKATYLKYSTTTDFNPYLLNLESARLLLRDLNIKNIVKSLDAESEQRLLPAG